MQNDYLLYHQDRATVLVVRLRIVIKSDDRFRKSVRVGWLAYPTRFLFHCHVLDAVWHTYAAALEAY